MPKWFYFIINKLLIDVCYGLIVSLHGQHLLLDFFYLRSSPRNRWIVCIIFSSPNLTLVFSPIQRTLIFSFFNPRPSHPTLHPTFLNDCTSSSPSPALSSPTNSFPLPWRSSLSAVGLSHALYSRGKKYPPIYQPPAAATNLSTRFIATHRRSS